MISDAVEEGYMYGKNNEICVFSFFSSRIIKCPKKEKLTYRNIKPAIKVNVFSFGFLQFINQIENFKIGYL